MHDGKALSWAVVKLGFFIFPFPQRKNMYVIVIYFHYYLIGISLFEFIRYITWPFKSGCRPSIARKVMFSEVDAVASKVVIHSLGLNT